MPKKKSAPPTIRSNNFQVMAGRKSAKHATRREKRASKYRHQYRQGQE